MKAFEKLVCEHVRLTVFLYCLGGFGPGFITNFPGPVA